MAFNASFERFNRGSSTNCKEVYITLVFGIQSWVFFPISIEFSTETQFPVMSVDKSDQLIEGWAKSLHFIPRSPILRRPEDYGLKYEDVFFPSYDGVPLEGWFIPCEGSQKLIIANHPMGFSRAGFPSHIEPWKSAFAETGNTIEINFLPDYKILHDAGYNVLAYDLRNFGHSGSANAQSCSAGRYESRDVIGSLKYVRQRPDLKDMTVGLFSRCLGCNSTMWAMHLYPEAFKDGSVRCMLGPQPVSVRAIQERNFQREGIPLSKMEDLDRHLRIQTSFGLDDLSPVKAAKSVSVPTFLYQVHDDVMTKPEDVQQIYDNIPVQDKELFWINGTTRRWDGYKYFQEQPQKFLAWLDKHMS